jgi:hypothetical protein
VRHEAVERRVELRPTRLAELPVTEHFAFDAVRGRVRMAAQRFDAGLWRVTMCVHNTTEASTGLDRAAAMRSSLLSTHPLLQLDGGRFLSLISPPEHAAGAVMTCRSVNTFPVLATAEDDALLGCAIMLHDHPQIAPESRGSLFDSTEIEEALLLHVLALSDEERDAAAAQDPAVRQMLERAARTTPQELMDLHGRVTVADPREGEPSAEVDGVVYRRGDTVVLRPGVNATAQDHLVAGRPATIERIYHDYDGTVHLAVTVDGVPGQDVMRDIGRYLFFKTTEVERA